MSDQRVLVVGTTPDYIAHIHELYSGQALFLTEISLRAESKETKPDENSEIVCRFPDKERIFSLLLEHLKRTDQKLSGVACYDCEWLSLAAEMAAYFDLPYLTHRAFKLKS